MDILLDSHTLIWSIYTPKLIPQKSLSLIESTENKSMVSIASLWEIAVKYSLKRLELSKGLESFFNSVSEAELEILPISTSHILGIASLPFHHKDPFDRIIITQAIAENLTIISKDRQFKNYGVAVIW
jgi:PIN domain nuclease of toxin-antitoxin system